MDLFVLACSVTMESSEEFMYVPPQGRESNNVGVFILLTHALD